VLLIIFLPSLVNFGWQLYKKPADVVFIQHFIYTSRSLKDSLFQHALDFICLPYEVYNNTDAIVRTIWRMVISGKNLLQWNPYTNSSDQKTIVNAYKIMWFAPFLALAIFSYLVFFYPVTLFKILPFLLTWALSPLIVWYISRPFQKKKIDITAEQTIYLRMLARKIWAFFETFVGEDDNWLPPDNYQEQPVERIAHRTSPTNIGVSLLANLSAYDFGYITAGELIDLTANTLTTMQRME
jgi:hypothetical protein